MKFNMNTIVQPGDVVSVFISGELGFYARVEEIGTDVKPGWLRIRLQVLTVPSRELVWILEPTQIDGDEFTMGGTPIRIERMPEPRPIWLFEDVHAEKAGAAEQVDGGPAPDLIADPGEGAEVISFPFGAAKENAEDEEPES